ncbi:MAG: GDSL-type esterase/lipase family protein [Candidatus Hydrogenedentes bacterium]|nr:GDSL-type esterase/lipase family protein [Candidatus Hydrogenedentota bacterium]
MFIGEQPAKFAFVPERNAPIVVRNTYLPGTDTTGFVESRDYVIDYANGTVRRTSESRIPNFQKNILYGQDNFDHNKFPGFGNKGYFAFVDYTPKSKFQWPRRKGQTKLLKNARAKLRSGAPVKIVAYGDSITSGGDATKLELIFWRRWADALQKKYPSAAITTVNGATGGDSTVQGLARLQEKVLGAQPDLVLIGFGMNDHNRGGVPIPQFESNLKEMIAKIRAATTAEIVLFSAFPPNPKWTYGTHNMEAYAVATGRVAAETNCAFADVFSNWQTIATRKKPEDLLGNNINHPNDYGHWIYFETLNAMGL